MRQCIKQIMENQLGRVLRVGEEAVNKICEAAQNFIEEQIKGGSIATGVMRRKTLSLRVCQIRLAIS